MSPSRRAGEDGEPEIEFVLRHNFRGSWDGGFVWWRGSDINEAMKQLEGVLFLVKGGSKYDIQARKARPLTRIERLERRVKELEANGKKEPVA